MKAFTLPDLGEGLAESEIVEWHVNIGDVVTLDQIILTVETAKATVDVPAPYSGTIMSRHGNEGDIINIGCLLVEIDEQVTATTAASGTSLPSPPSANRKTTSSSSSKNREHDTHNSSTPSAKNDAATVVAMFLKLATTSISMNFG